jgi:hypothetical protein
MEFAGCGLARVLNIDSEFNMIKKLPTYAPDGKEFA